MTLVMAPMSRSATSWMRSRSAAPVVAVAPAPAPGDAVVPSPVSVVVTLSSVVVPMSWRSAARGGLRNPSGDLLPWTLDTGRAAPVVTGWRPRSWARGRRPRERARDHLHFPPPRTSGVAVRFGLVRVLVGPNPLLSTIRRARAWAGWPGRASPSPPWGLRASGGAPTAPLHSTPSDLRKCGTRRAEKGQSSLTVEQSGVSWGFKVRNGDAFGSTKGRWRTMFLGTHTPRLDEKGPLFLPAKYRERMAGGLAVTRGQERSLFIYPMDEFGKVARDYMRVFLSGASDELPDKQGRFTIPANLRQYAGLDREVTVIGAGARLEVWDSAVWNAYLEQTEQSFADTAQEVIPGLF